MTISDNLMADISTKAALFDFNKVTIEDVGIVKKIQDGIVLLTGLDNVAYGDIVIFESGVEGYIIDLAQHEAGAIVLGDYLTIKSGDKVVSSGKTLSIPVDDRLIGRVVSPIGSPLDGKSRINSKIFYPLEKIAPGVVYRKSVSVPLQTGLKAIDALIPIGRGQRQLILGDRGTGKTTIAVDTIINQKGKDVICVYCAIGQKNSKVAALIELLRKQQSMDYTVVVSASASQPASLQYLAPYAATAIAEYFMDKGKDVLIVYDDLTKHAWAYREVSLILRRPAGREAYPGDVFYLHSRLLERSCRRDEKYGGGSITALPIIETLDGDVSGYIPTNIISITDGQIFLESDLFNSGIRPAINVGISVSRVGGNAQAKAMKQVAGRLKLDLAQYREISAFSQFESELDEATKTLLNRGSKITRLLKQNKNQPLSLGEQVVVIWAGTKGYLDNIPADGVEAFEGKLLQTLRLKAKKLVATINEKKILTEVEEKELEAIVKECL